MKYLLITLLFVSHAYSFNKQEKKFKVEGRDYTIFTPPNVKNTMCIQAWTYDSVPLVCFKDEGKNKKKANK